MTTHVKIIFFCEKWMSAVTRYNYISAHSFLKDQIREVISRELYFRCSHLYAASVEASSYSSSSREEIRWREKIRKFLASKSIFRHYNISWHAWLNKTSVCSFIASLHRHVKDIQCRKELYVRLKDISMCLKRYNYLSVAHNYHYLEISNEAQGV